VKGLRADFRERAATWAAEKLKFLDESGVYLGMTRRYGWAPAGERVVDTVPTNYGTPWTMVATLGVGGVQAPWLLEGAMTGAAFDTYVTHVLAPTLQPGDSLILDNLAAHKQAGVRAAVEACGARVECLAPYSPDFNPIELCWAKVKQALRSAKAKTHDALLEALAAALRTVSTADIAHWLRHCGYALL
jgi:transposase